MRTKISQEGCGRRKRQLLSAEKKARTYPNFRLHIRMIWLLLCGPHRAHSNAKAFYGLFSLKVFALDSSCLKFSSLSSFYPWSWHLIRFNGPREAFVDCPIIGLASSYLLSPIEILVFPFQEAWCPLFSTMWTSPTLYKAWGQCWSQPSLGVCTFT